jgi:hypothetical protein
MLAYFDMSLERDVFQSRDTSVWVINSGSFKAKAQVCPPRLTAAYTALFSGLYSQTLHCLNAPPDL